MSATKPTQILVGVADAEAEAVLDAAVAEARRRGAGLHLVHAVGPFLQASDLESQESIAQSSRRDGAAILEAAAQSVRQRGGDDVPVSTELVHGPPAPTLTAMGTDRGLVFLERRAYRHVPTLSVTNAVAARSQAVVVVVPAGIDPPAESAPVVVGVKDAELSVEVVRAALDAARSRGVVLRIVHAWSYSPGYDDLVFVGTARIELEDRVRSALDHALGDLLAEYPDVRTELVIRHGGEADVLVREAGDAGLVVLGRHQSRVPFLPHLGSVARGVLRAAPCPVMVVDPLPTAVPTEEVGAPAQPLPEGHPLVVAAVDGSPASEAAIRRAVHEARSDGGALRLVHVVPDYVPVSTMMPLWPADLAATGRGILRSAERVARAAGPDVEIESRLAHGSRVRAIVEAAEDARLLVLGRDRSMAQRLVTGRTAAAVAGRSPCPVEAVSADRTDDDVRGVVVVGVRSAEDDITLLADALEVAADRGARLVVLHAWAMPSGYDGLVEAGVAADAWDRRCTEILEPVLDGLRTRYPAVPTELRIVRARPAHALVEASQEADLVVLMRRHERGPSTWRLGGTTRAVLGGAHCDVRVVPPPAPVGTPAHGASRDAGRVAAAHS